MTKDKQIEEMRHLADEMGKAISNEYKKRVLADERKLEAVLKENGWRKASDVAREIFEAFRTEMRAEISRNEQLFAEDEDDFYEGRNDAYRTAINCLADLKRKYEESEGTE